MLFPRQEKEVVTPTAEVADSLSPLLLIFPVKPEAWVSKGTSPGPGRLLLVCHVSGFHPKPVWVRWMRGEKVQPGTQQGEVLPNADRTWYLRVTLDVAAREATGLTCRVKHSSLGGHDLIVHWGEEEPGPLGEMSVFP